MAVQTNITETVTINTSSAKATGIRKLVKNITGADIVKFKPIVNAGWDTDEDCMLIRLPNSKNDVILGVTVDIIRNNTVVPAQYVSSGIVLGMDTSAWAINEFIYAKTDGTFTNNPYADPTDTIPQEIGLILRSHATKGEVFISAIGSQVKYIKLAMSLIEAESGSAGSNDDGDTIHLLSGSGDGNGSGGDVILEPGLAGATGDDGVVIIKQPGTAKVDGFFAQLWHNGTDFLFRVYKNTLAGTFVFLNKVIFRNVADIDESKQIEIEHDGDNASLKTKKGNFLFEGVKFLFRKLGAVDGAKDLEIWLDTDNHVHIKSNSGYIKVDSTAFQIMAASYSAGKHVDVGHDGTDAFIFTTVGELSTKNTVVNTGTAKIKAATALLASLTASQLVETDADKNLVSVTKKTAYNKDFGYRSGEIASIGNDFSASQVVETNADKELRSVAKKTGFNLDLGSTSGTVSEGNHNHDSAYHPKVASSFSTTKTWSGGTNSHSVEIENGIIKSWTITSI